MAYALTANNPSMIAMLGPGYELEDYNLGTAFAMDMLIFTAIAAGIMNILLVGKSTRADEESGLTEVIRSLPIGRLSNLSATMIGHNDNQCIACLILQDWDCSHLESIALI